MIKNYRAIATEISQKLSISEQEINQVLRLFGQEATDKLQSFGDIEVYLYGLGSFVARRKKIYDLIKYYQVRKERLEQLVVKANKEGLIFDCEEKIEKLKKLNELYKARDSKRRELKNEQITGDIQEPQADMGRLAE